MTTNFFQLIVDLRDDIVEVRRLQQSGSTYRMQTETLHKSFPSLLGDYGLTADRLYHVAIRAAAIALCMKAFPETVTTIVRPM